MAAEDAQQIRDELTRLGIDPDKTSGLRVRESQYAGFVKLAASKVPAEEMEMDAGQVKEKLAELDDGAGRDAVLTVIGFPRNIKPPKRS